MSHIVPWEEMFCHNSMLDEKIVSWRSLCANYSAGDSHGGRHGREDKICSAGDGVP
jgi:hypothetical protein